MLNVYRYDLLTKSDNSSQVEKEIEKHKIKTELLTEKHNKRTKDFMFKVSFPYLILVDGYRPNKIS